MCLIKKKMYITNPDIILCPLNGFCVPSKITLLKQVKRMAEKAKFGSVGYGGKSSGDHLPQ